MFPVPTCRERVGQNETVLFSRFKIHEHAQRMSREMPPHVKRNYKCILLYVRRQQSLIQTNLGKKNNNCDALLNSTVSPSRIIIVDTRWIMVMLQQLQNQYAPGASVGGLKIIDYVIILQEQLCCMLATATKF